MKLNRATRSPLVSVILPVYNTKNYLEQCLTSLREQSLTDIEVIIIDDGSTDGSENICDRHAAQDSRLKVIHKKNEGLSAARNDGLDIATADYIMFVDSDDWVEPDFCEEPIKIAADIGADMVAFPSIRYEKKSCRRNISSQSGSISKNQALTELWPYVTVNAWNKLYHRKLFEGIRFPVGHLSEDTAVMHHLIDKACCIYLSDHCLYHHRDYRPGSITNNKSKRFIEDHYNYNLIRLNDLECWGFDITEERKRLAWSYLLMVGRRGEASRICDEIVRQADFCNSAYFSLKAKIMYHIYCLNPCLFEFLTVLAGRRNNKI